MAGSNLSSTHQAKGKAAAEHLSKNDPRLKPLVKKIGLFTPQPHTDYYHELVSSIIGQQLSVKAAATIERRFKDLFGDKLPTPEQIIKVDPETLRGVGFSRAKAAYVIDLARHILDGRLKLDELAVLSNEEIMKELVAVKGIGEWTAHMFLIFALGRLDILPTGDLGLRSGIKKLYDLKELPASNEIRELANLYNWHPYESVACWYIWQAFDT